MDEEFLDQKTNSEDLDKTGSVLASYKVELILFVGLIILLLAVFVLYALQVITLFVANCILIPVAIIVILFFAFKLRK